jgi:hypothetical protein
MTRYSDSYRDINRKVSALQRLARILILASFSLFAVITTSCEKGVLKLGTDLLPEEDFVAISSIDTLSIFSYTMYEDRIRSDNPSVSYLGQINDPTFGTTGAEFVTQLRLNEKWTGGGHVKIDSVFLYWHLLSASGGTSTAQTMKLTEISEVLYPDSAYYSDRKPKLTASSWDNIQIPVGIAGDTSIKVILPNEFGEHIFNDPSQLFYANQIHFNPAFPDFRSYFKGLYVQMHPSTDPMLVSLYLSPPDANNTAHTTATNFIAIFVTDSLGVSSEFDLIFDSKLGNAAYNIYSHDYTTADPALSIKHINDNYRDTLSYLQYLNGVYTKIVLPGLEKLKTDGTLGKIGVNKARLVVPIHITDSSKYISDQVPPQLVLRYKNDEGSNTLVPDYVMGSDYYDKSHQFFDGNLDSINHVYNFNIPQFVQSYLDGTGDIVKPEFEIYQGAGTRNVVFGANKNRTPVKFEFTYTKF